jgi:transposase-like protein
MTSLHARLQDVRRLLRNAEGLELSVGAVQRLKWFAYALEHDENISLTCRHFGIARSTFLRWAERFDAHDIATLEEQSRRPHTVRTPDTDARVIDLVRALRTQHTNMSKETITQILREQHGVDLSVSTVGRIITRHKMFFGSSPSHRQKRGEAMWEETTRSITPIESSPSRPAEGTEGQSLLPESGLSS